MAIKLEKQNMFIFKYNVLKFNMYKFNRNDF